jgi:hypothetical protein
MAVEERPPRWVVSMLVRSEGFEPPTPGFEARCSDPLSYERIYRARWSRRWESNPQPAVYKTAALPIELRRHGGADRIRTGDLRRDRPAL